MRDLSSFTGRSAGGTIHSQRGSGTIYSSPSAFRPQWSPDGQWIVYDEGVPYKIYRIRPDGTDRELLLDMGGLNCGAAQIDPTGRYVVFSAEQESHYPFKALTATDPGGGYCNDVAILDLQTRAFTRIHVAGNGLDGQAIGGSLFPRFSHSGTRIAWGDYLNAGTPGVSKFGSWQIAGAMFAPLPTPQLTSLHTYAPPKAGIYEIQGWTPDDSGLVISCAPAVGQDEYALDITRFGLSDGRFTQLTFTSGLNGQSAEYEEHGDISPDGLKLAFMSSAGYGIDPNTLFINWLKTELWIADADGSHPQQVTFFNVPGRPGYNGQRTVVSMLSWSPDSSRLVANVYHYADATRPAKSEIVIFNLASN